MWGSYYFTFSINVQCFRKIILQCLLIGEFEGMMHLMDHEEVNDSLAKLLESEGLDAQLSYDGLRIPIRL